MPVISVLMGIYNCERTISGAIESIRNQTFRDWELILCDDASTDSTAEIAESFCRKDPRIRLIRNDNNKKLSFTLNRCFSLASGEFCARMDGDDLCSPDRFSIQLKFLQKHPEYSFTTTVMKRFDEKGIWYDPEISDGFEPGRNDLIKGSPFCHATMVIRKSALAAINGYRVLSETEGTEDYDLWFRLYAAGFRGYVIGLPLYQMFDGKAAEKRRTFRRRLNEARIRFQGYRLLKIPIPLRIYLLKPFIAWLTPSMVRKQRSFRKK